MSSKITFLPKQYKVVRFSVPLHKPNMKPWQNYFKCYVIFISSKTQNLVNLMITHTASFVRDFWGSGDGAWSWYHSSTKKPHLINWDSIMQLKYASKMLSCRCHDRSNGCIPRPKAKSNTAEYFPSLTFICLFIQRIFIKNCAPRFTTLSASTMYSVLQQWYRWVNLIIALWNLCIVFFFSITKGHSKNKLLRYLQGVYYFSNQTGI